MDQNRGKSWGITSRACSKCGGDLSHRYGKQRYCAACHAAYMRATRPKYHELPDHIKMRSNARSYANQALRRGQIKREPCLICGAKRAQMHHEDYSKPLQVIWVCRPCHLQHHNDQKSRLSHVLNLLHRADLLIQDQRFMAF